MKAYAIGYKDSRQDLFSKIFIENQTNVTCNFNLEDSEKPVTLNIIGKLVDTDGNPIVAGLTEDDIPRVEIWIKIGTDADSVTYGTDPFFDIVPHDFLAGKLNSDGSFRLESFEDPEKPLYLLTNGYYTLKIRSPIYKNINKTFTVTTSPGSGG